MTFKDIPIPFDTIAVTHYFWRQPGVSYCICFGVLDYQYASQWKCRDCGRWHEL